MKVGKRQGMFMFSSQLKPQGDLTGPIICLDNDEPVMTASENQPVEEVTNVTLTCSDRTSDNVTGYLWYKNGVLIGESTNMKLSLPNNTRADDGQYSCEVNTNKVPKSSMSNTITINFLCKSSSCLILYHPNCLHIQ